MHTHTGHHFNPMHEIKMEGKYQWIKRVPLNWREFSLKFCLKIISLNEKQHNVGIFTTVGLKMQSKIISMIPIKVWRTDFNSKKIKCFWTQRFSVIPLFRHSKTMSMYLLGARYMKNIVDIDLKQSVPIFKEARQY